MSVWKDPDSGAEIRTQLTASVSDVVELKPIPEIGELFLDELRELVRRCAHMPGAATVTTRVGGIISVESRASRAVNDYDGIPPAPQLPLPAEDGHVCIEDCDPGNCPVAHAQYIEYQREREELEAAEPATGSAEAVTE